MTDAVNLMIDSGAVNFYNRMVKGSTKGSPGNRFEDRLREDHSYVKSEEFLSYREKYIRFIKKNRRHITFYINLDIINNAQGSYDSLKYLESKGLSPLPVFHLGNDTKWLERYIKEGYDFICIGGITPNPWKAVKPALDKIWSEILTDRTGMPIVKVHGLAATSYRLMTAYPWWSVDSSSWLKLAIYGNIAVPPRKNGKYRMDVAPYSAPVSIHRTKTKIDKEDVLPTIKRKNRLLSREVLEWLNEIEVPVGTVNEMGDEVEWGVTSNWEARSLANLRYFKRLADSMPKWPWPFKIHQKPKTLF